MNTPPANVKTIFVRAIEIDEPAARAAYIDQACAGNASLRAEVEALLQAHQRAGQFMNNPAPQRVATFIDQSVAEEHGAVIGPYKLLEKIGEGGMGVVFMADQQAPVRRRVALKIIKPGMDTGQVIARFEAERQALAMMDHPNIARVLDAGATGSGRPYFVMELVRGVPITEYCDKNNLSVSERLAIFVPVCQAVQHAHQKGIIHRDIKPSNVLVTLHDGVPVPKVIDFGVAKATNQQLTDKTLFTSFAQMVGTPLYMSPEQAEMSGLDVDTRSDIYSLGVLLYELLTGTTPFDSGRLNKAAIDEIRRIIREEEPPKPSTRLSSLGETSTEVAGHRRVDPARLNQLIRGDLDWIVMKALEKDRTRRYETANGLARDVQRYLTDQPVEACPPSAAYRFRKFARRNRVAFGTAALVGLALVLGTVISTWQAIRATKAQEQARAAENLAETRLDAERRAHDEAQVNLKRTRQAVDEYFTQVSQSKLFDVPSLQPLRKDLLEAAVRYYETLLNQQGNDPAILADVAVAHLRVAEIYHETDRNGDAVDELAKALELVERLRRDHPAAKQDHERIAGFWKGQRSTRQETAMREDPEKAERTLKKFVTLWEDLAREHPTVVAFQNDLAAAYSTLANWQATATTIMGSHALAEEAVVMSRKAMAIWERLSREYPAVAEYRDNLAMVHREFRFRLNGAGRKQEVAAALAQSLELTEKLVTEFPKIPQYRVYLADSLNARAHELEAARKAPEAVQVYERRSEIAKGLVAEFPSVAEYFFVYCKSALDLVRVRRSLGRNDEAKATMQEVATTLQAFKTRVGDQSSPLEHRLESAEALSDLGLALLNCGEPPLAESAINESINLGRRLASDAPSDPKHRWTLAHALRVLYLAIQSLPDRAADGLRALGEAEAIFAQLSAQAPNNAEYARYVAETASWISDHLGSMGRKKESLQKLRRSLELYEQYHSTFPDSAEARGDLSHISWRVASASESDGQIREAEVVLRRSEEVFEKADAMSANNLAWNLATRPELELRAPLTAVSLARMAVKAAPAEGNFRNTLGVAEYRAGDWKAAETSLRKSMELRAGGDSYEWFFLAMTASRLGQKDQARKWYDAASLWTAKHAAKDSEFKRFRAEATELLGIPLQPLPPAVDDAAVARVVVEADPETKSLWCWRSLAEIHMQAGRWSEAKPLIRRWGELVSNDPYGHYYVAALLARAGDVDVYRRHCQQLLTQFAETDKPEWAERTAKVSLMLPPTAATLAAASRLSARAVRLGEKNWVLPFAQVPAALAAYRRGEFQASVDWCDQVLTKKVENVFFREAQAQSIRAMALVNLDKGEETRTSFKRADLLLHDMQAAARAHVPRDWWHDLAMCELLQKEAQEVLLERRPMDHKVPAEPSTKP